MNEGHRRRYEDFIIYSDLHKTFKNNLQFRVICDHIRIVMFFVQTSEIPLLTTLITNNYALWLPIVFEFHTRF